MPSLRSSAPFLLLATMAAQTPAAPKFVAGDLTTLECRVIEAKAVASWLQLLTVEVNNRGAAAAEPLVFRVELPRKKGEAPAGETFARVQLPFVNRHGRPAPAGGKQTYVVPTALAGKKPQFTVRVLDASFCDGGAVAKPDVQVGAPAQVQVKSLAGEFPVTQVKVKNPLAHDVDLLFAVTLTQPGDSVDLFGLRLPANGAVDWTIGGRPGARPFADVSVPGSAVKATRFELVDWSLVAPVAAGAGEELLRGPYEAWCRWPDAQPALGGAFVYRERRQKAGSLTEYEAFEVRGRFTVTGDRQLTIDGKGDPANPRLSLVRALENLLRPDFAALAKENRLVPVANDRVAIEGKGWSWNDGAGGARLASDAGRTWNDLQAAGDRIVSDGDGGGPRTLWETRPMGAGYVVTRRHGASIDSRFSYAEVDGRIVPSASTSTTKYGDTVFSSDELLLSELKFDGVQPIAPKAVAGDGAAALRAIWDAGHHYPAAPIELQARFELTNPGTDLLWNGHQKLRGKITMKGIGRRARDVDVTFDGDLTPVEKFALAGAVRDRLLMWYGRDFGDRPGFDEFFAGATIGAATDGGEYPVTGGRVSAVATAGGLVRGWRTGASTTKFTWKALGGVQAVVRVDEAFGAAGARSQDRWDSATVITLAKVGEHLLPTAITFERIFGRDWGPESLVLRDVQVR